jgi:hypothetical protein
VGVETFPGVVHRTADPSTSLRCPGFPVDLGGVGALPAPFFTEGRMRGDFRRSVAGNPGSVGMTRLLGNAQENRQMQFLSRQGAAEDECGRAVFQSSLAGLIQLRDDYPGLRRGLLSDVPSGLRRRST